MWVLPCRYDRYRVVARSGVSVHAAPGFASRIIHQFALDDELSIDREDDANGIVWLHHAHGLGDDERCLDDATKGGGGAGAATVAEKARAGDGQGWISVLSEEGHVQMERMERRKPVTLIQAGGERSFAFTGDKKPLRRHLSQV